MTIDMDDMRIVKKAVGGVRVLFQGLFIFWHDSSQHCGARPQMHACLPSSHLWAISRRNPLQPMKETFIWSPLQPKEPSCEYWQRTAFFSYGWNNWLVLSTTGVVVADTQWCVVRNGGCISQALSANPFQSCR
jgi:hypothetical protein